MREARFSTPQSLVLIKNKGDVKHIPFFVFPEIFIMVIRKHLLKKGGAYFPF